MLNWLLRRILAGIGTILVISFVSFVIIQLPPGDFVTSYIARLAEDGTATSLEDAARLRQIYGLDDPLVVQYAHWMGEVVQGDFGQSLTLNRPVGELIGERLPLSLAVSLSALLFTWLIALPIGIYSAVKQYSIGDHLATFVGFMGLAIPNFLLALILMYVGFKYFGADIGGLFSAAYETQPWGWGKFADLLKHLPIPAIVLGAAGTASLIRIMRANLLDELRKPYVATARAKGLSSWRATVKYPVRVAMNPFASSIGFLFPQIVSGAVIVSVVLSLPTLGPLLLSALLSQDMFLAGTIILLLGVMTVVGTIVSDLVLFWLDPRIRHG